MYNLRLKKYNNNNIKNTLLSKYNLKTKKKFINLDNLEYVLGYKLNEKKIKKIPYDIFLTFFFFMYLLTNQYPKYNKVKKKNNIYIDQFKICITKNNIYNCLEKLIILSLINIRFNDSITFRKNRKNNILLYLKKLNFFYNLKFFPQLQELLKYEFDYLNFKINFNFNNMKLMHKSLNINYLRLIQLPININRLI